MKRIRIVQAVALIAVVVVMTSCSSGREYSRRPYPPRSGVSLSLIIAPPPGVVLLRGPGGRFYYRAPGGYIYWRGYNNMYYLDRKYVGRSYYGHRQYNDWRRYYYNGRRRR